MAAKMAITFAQNGYNLFNIYFKVVILETKPMFWDQGTQFDQTKSY